MARADPAFFPKLLTLFGISVFFLGRFFQNLSPAHIYSPVKVASRNTLRYFSPKKIAIARIGLELPVKLGGIVQGDWILSDDATQFLPTSGLLSEGFNTIIYAHRLPNLFGNLEKISFGDKITLWDEVGREFVYQVYEREIIDPGEITKLYSKTENVLTLFTCDGWFDTSRLIIRAKMVDQPKYSLPNFSFQEPKSSQAEALFRFSWGLQ